MLLLLLLQLLQLLPLWSEDQQAACLNEPNPLGMQLLL